MPSRRALLALLLITLLALVLWPPPAGALPYDVHACSPPGRHADPGEGAATVSTCAWRVEGFATLRDRRSAGGTFRRSAAHEGWAAGWTFAAPPGSTIIGVRSGPDGRRRCTSRSSTRPPSTSRPSTVGATPARRRCRSPAIADAASYLRARRAAPYAQRRRCSVGRVARLAVRVTHGLSVGHAHRVAESPWRPSSQARRSGGSDAWLGRPGSIGRERPCRFDRRLGPGLRASLVARARIGRSESSRKLQPACRAARTSTATPCPSYLADARLELRLLDDAARRSRRPRSKRSTRYGNASWSGPLRLR